MAQGSAISSRRVTLHCGVQKTASTALHHFLAQNAAALAPHLTVRTPVQGTPAQRMGRAAIAFSLDPNPATEAALAALIRETRDEIGSGAAPVLISHENLPGAMLGNPGVTTLYPMLERILALLEENLAPWVPSFAFYTRDMAAWKTSVHNQAVKTDGYCAPLEGFLDETRACGSWSALAARIAAVLPPARHRFFALEDEPDRSRPGQQLLAFAGVPAEVRAGLGPLAGPVNQSLNAGALEFMRKLNQTGLSGPPRMKVMRTVMNNQALFAPTLPEPGRSDAGAH